MPYNVDKDQGGDNKNNTSWMEKCVDSVMSKGNKDKSSAVAICKAQLKKKKESEFIYDPNIVKEFEDYREQWIRKNMNRGKTFSESNAEFIAYLSINNYDVLPY